MNKIVAISEVAGFALRVKSASSETFLFEVVGPGVGTGKISANFSDTQVEFELTTNLLNKLYVGEYYKVQIAYVNSLDEIGYYSTIGIIKYTGAPQAWIADFNPDVPNQNRQKIIGTYSNETDPTEREAEYRFTVYAYDKITELTSTGWKSHIVSNNIETAIVADDYSVTYAIEQTDEYDLKYVLDPMSTYYIRYEIRTNNGLYKASPLYEIVENTTMNSTLLADLIAEMDYDNACVILTLLPRAKLSDAIIVGTFEIGRSAAIDNYAYWTTISKFSLNGHLPSDGRIFTDFTIEQGQKYKYAIRQLNSYNIYSSWIPITKWRILGTEVWNENPYVEAAFEDAYLYDGKRQLRIRFNPKVSSFKTVLMDTKKTAIGSKYPYFFRNGIVGYKEFPISGLISYLSDQDQYFAKRTSELGMPTTWEDTTDITDANLAYERRFKTIVLDWLNENTIKLYKSPSEGNFLVRLSNVSLTPNDSLSRMLHTFSCTADEVADYTTDKLIDEGFISVELENENLQTLFMTKLFTRGEENPADIFQGYKGIYIKLENFLPMSKFILGGTTYFIGQTGQYELYLNQPANGLSIPQTTLNECWDAGLSPNVTYGIQSKGFTSFDIITQLSAQKFSYVRRMGADANILEPYFDLKHQIERIYYIHFTTKEVIDTDISFNAILKYIDEANKGNDLDLAIDVNAMYRIPASDELIQYFLANGRITSGELRHNQLVYLYVDNVGRDRFNLHMDKEYSAEVIFGKKLRFVDDVGNRFYEDNVLDFSHTGSEVINNLNYIPIDENENPYIKIGNGIIAEFGLYQKVINYDMETNVNKISADNQSRFQRLYQQYAQALNEWYGTAANYYRDGAGYKEFWWDYNYQKDNPSANYNYNHGLGRINNTEKNALHTKYINARTAYMNILQEELDKRESEATIV